MSEEYTKHTEDQKKVSNSLENSDNFEVIIDLFEQPLSRYLRRLGMYEKEDIEDNLQEIFIRIYTNLNDYDETYPLSSWVYRIAYNQAMTFFKKNSKLKKVYYDNSEMEEKFIDETDINEITDKQINKKILSEAIEELSPKYKDVVILKFIEEKDYTEISYILQKPIGTVGTLINRGKKELREILQKKNINTYE